MYRLGCESWCYATIPGVFVNNQIDAQFFFSYLFIPVLYMFRATKCSSSGESIVSIRPLVYVTVCRWTCGMHTSIPHGHLHTVTYTRGSKPAYHTVTYIQWHTRGSKPAYHTVTYIQWHTRGSKPAHHTVTYIQWHIPEGLNLHTTRSPTNSDMYQRSYWYNWLSWWWALGCSKQVENCNKQI